MSTFTSPGAASDTNWSARDSIGHLLIIEPTAHEQGVITAFGEKDAVRASITDVDTSDVFPDTLIFQGGLIGALKGRIGQKVLARLGHGTAKPGQAPPYILTDASGDPAAVKAAEAALAAQAADRYTAPASPAAAGSEADALAAAKALLEQQGATELL